MIDEINKEAFELIKTSFLSKLKESPDQREELKGSIKERGFLDWSHKLVGGGIEKATNHAGETVSIFYIDKNETLGFDELSYPQYKSLLKKICSLNEFKNKVAEDFIETQSFNWMLDVYLKQKAGISLIDHLRLEIESNIANFQFYFPVLNLEIEEPFAVGNVEFIFFTKEYIDNLCTSLQGQPEQTDEKQFGENIKKDYQGQVLAKLTVKAEREIAEDIAMIEAENAVNVLKIYGLTPIIPEKRTMFDLNFRLNYQVKTNFLSQNIDQEKGLALNLKFNNQPFHFTKQHLI